MYRPIMVGDSAICMPKEKTSTKSCMEKFSLLEIL